MPQRALEEIVAAVNLRCILGYEILGPVITTADLTIAAASTVTLTASTSTLAPLQ